MAATGRRKHLSVGGVVSGVAAGLFLLSVATAIWSAYYDLEPNRCVEFTETPIYTQIEVVPPGSEPPPTPLKLQQAAGPQAESQPQADGAGWTLIDKRLAVGYRLWSVIDGSDEGDSSSSATATHVYDGAPVLFVHGHRGSYNQSKTFAAVAKASAAPLSFFTLDFLEESSAFHSAVLWTQAWYVNRAVRTLLDAYAALPVAHPFHGVKSVFVLAHSMGGIVVRAAMLLPNYVPGSFRTILTFSSPHQAHPYTSDFQVADFYQVVNSAWAFASTNHTASPVLPRIDLSDVVLVSFGGGARDTVVRSDLCSVRGLAAPHASMTVFTTGVPGVWLQMDHHCILWCGQFVSLVVSAVSRLLQQRDQSVTARLDLLRHTFDDTLHKLTFVRPATGHVPAAYARPRLLDCASATLLPGVPTALSVAGSNGCCTRVSDAQPHAQFQLVAMSDHVDSLISLLINDRDLRNEWLHIPNWPARAHMHHSEFLQARHHHPLPHEASPPMNGTLQILTATIAAGDWVCVEWQGGDANRGAVLLLSVEPLQVLPEAELPIASTVGSLLSFRFMHAPWAGAFSSWTWHVKGTSVSRLPLSQAISPLMPGQVTVTRLPESGPSHVPPLPPVLYYVAGSAGGAAGCHGCEAIVLTPAIADPSADHVTFRIATHLLPPEAHSASPVLTAVLDPRFRWQVDLESESLGFFGALIKYRAPWVIAAATAVTFLVLHVQLGSWRGIEVFPSILTAVSQHWLLCSVLSIALAVANGLFGEWLLGPSWDAPLPKPAIQSSLRGAPRLQPYEPSTMEWQTPCVTEQLLFYFLSWCGIFAFVWLFRGVGLCVSSMLRLCGRDQPGRLQIPCAVMPHTVNRKRKHSGGEEDVFSEEAPAPVVVRSVTTQIARVVAWVCLCFLVLALPWLAVPIVWISLVIVAGATHLVHGDRVQSIVHYQQTIIILYLLVCGVKTMAVLYSVSSAQGLRVAFSSDAVWVLPIILHMMFARRHLMAPGRWPAVLALVLCIVVATSCHRLLYRLPFAISCFGFFAAAPVMVQGLQSMFSKAPSPSSPTARLPLDSFEASRRRRRAQS